MGELTEQQKGDDAGLLAGLERVSRYIDKKLGRLTQQQKREVRREFEQDFGGPGGAHRMMELEKSSPLVEYHCDDCDVSYFVPLGRTMFDDVTTCPLCDANTWPVKDAEEGVG